MGDVLLAAGLALAGLLPLDQPFGRDPDALFYALYLAGAAAVALRRRFPAAVLVLTCGSLGLMLGLGYLPGLIMGPALAGLYTAAVRGMRLWAAAGLAAALAGAAFLPEALAVRAIYTLTWAGMLGCAVLAGEFVRARARAAEHAERLRIARELHDVLGHGMAAITVQSATALHLLGDAHPEVRQALQAIRDTSKQAMGRVRDSVFRESESLTGIDDLLGAVRQAGLPVEVTGSPGELRPDVDHAAYRIIQEALTNALRHAGPGASAGVRLERTPRALLIDVTDDGGGGLGRAGSGIEGMKARARALGGHVRVRSGAPLTGVKVSARLPLRPGPLARLGRR
ncbi:histidine kinase [Nonomuraea sp. NPDC055795]